MCGGQYGFLTLSSHAPKHSNCYSNIVEAAEHSSKHGNVNVRLSNIDADHSPGGYRNNFKPTALYVIKVDSVEVIQSTKRALSYYESANISNGNLSGT